jgi:hypothetical protein
MVESRCLMLQLKLGTRGMGEGFHQELTITHHNDDEAKASQDDGTFSE